MASGSAEPEVDGHLWPIPSREAGELFYNSARALRRCGAELRMELRCQVREGRAARIAHVLGPIAAREGPEGAVARRISIGTRAELLAAVGERYRNSGRGERSRILDKFGAVTCYTASTPFGCLRAARRPRRALRSGGRHRR